MTQLERRRTLYDRFEPWVLSEALTRHDLAVAVALADMCGEDDQHLILALAFAVAAPQSGHTAVDLRQIREHTLVSAESRSSTQVTEIEDLPWPQDAAEWLEEVSESRLVTSTQSPLVVDRGLIYLRRFFHHEERVAERLGELARAQRSTVSNAEVSNVLHLSQNQQHAVEVCGRARLGVLTGPPGSGKTRTVAALVADEFVASPTARVALAAPTGKAAARMAESVAESIDLLSATDDEPIVAAASALQLVVPSTVHRLLGARGSDSFRYDLHNPLPFDLVVVDEASMLSLPLVDALLQALHPTARLVFVGDAGQLASVDAGSVLGDIAGADGPIHSCVAELTETHRFPTDSVIGQFSSAVLRGDSDAAAHVIDKARGASALSTSETDGIVLEMVEEPADVDQFVRDHAVSLSAKAFDGDIAGALRQLDAFRVLCAHRSGPFGVDGWNVRAERLLERAEVQTRGHYPGQPIMVTANDPTRRLFNGDVGVVVRDDRGLWVAFPNSDLPPIDPVSLSDHTTVHAMTIHKSQGSEFDHVVVVLPPEGSRLATRELLYTAVTRARRRVTLVGSRASVLAALSRSERRVSGLRHHLETAQEHG